MHETDELCFVAKVGELKGLSCWVAGNSHVNVPQARTEFPQWMVGTDIDGRLPVTLEMDPKSKEGMGLSLYPGCKYSGIGYD